MSGTLRRMDVEECLRQIQGKAALLRYLASCASINPEIPDPAVLAGMADACSEIESLAEAIKGELSVTALGVQVRCVSPHQRG